MTLDEVCELGARPFVVVLAMIGGFASVVMNMAAVMLLMVGTFICLCAVLLFFIEDEAQTIRGRMAIRAAALNATSSGFAIWATWLTIITAGKATIVFMLPLIAALCGCIAALHARDVQMGRRPRLVKLRNLAWELLCPIALAVGTYLTLTEHWQQACMIVVIVALFQFGSMYEWKLYRAHPII